MHIAVQKSSNEIRTKRSLYLNGLVSDKLSVGEVNIDSVKVIFNKKDCKFVCQYESFLHSFRR